MSNDDSVKVQIVDRSDQHASEPRKVKPGAIVVQDARGRSIGIGKPPFDAQFDLVEALGTSADNKTYLGMVSLLSWVKSIDGDPVSLPTTKLQIKALLKRLDEDGYTAVALGIAENFVSSVDEDALQAAVKNA